MSVARVICRTQLGLEAPLVHVEVGLSCGLPSFCMVGLPATVVRESKERVRAALQHSNFEFPAGRITVNLAPAELPKEGGRFDLPIAVGILLASGQVAAPALCRTATAPCELYGELGLAGELRPTPGLLLAALHAGRDGHELIVPRASAEEALIAASTPVRAADHLLEICAHLEGRSELVPMSRPASQPRSPLASALDLSEVRGQLHAKRALVIAAAGAHSLLMVGSPGSGKTMLAQRLPGLLPPLSAHEALEVAAIFSVSGAGFNASHFGRRPFRCPHHTASGPALVGGGARARPGEASLAHHGVLFLDELPEFTRDVLDTLREPLEAGVVSVSRAARHAQYPACFQLVAAMNPCPCGRLGDPRTDCACTPAEVRRYRGRVSAPLLERIDLQIEVPCVAPSEFADGAERGENSASAAARVCRARQIQLARQGVCNARLTDAQVERVCGLDASGKGVLELAMQRRGFSARTRQRVLKLARTIADLEDSPSPTLSAAHVGQAVMFRLDAFEALKS